MKQRLTHPAVVSTSARIWSANQGFTLVEMIVSLAIFAIVATVAIGALLVLVGTNQRLQGEQSVMTNLSFALDSMTREIRTGAAYYCAAEATNTSLSSIFNPNSDIDSILQLSTRDCASGNGTTRFRGLAFIEGGDSISASDDRILYYFDSEDKTLYRRVGNSAPQSIISSGITIEEFDFFVTGSDTLRAGGTGATRQPTVTIYIKATEKGAVNEKPYYIQTTVTQRTLDV